MVFDDLLFGVSRDDNCAEWIKRQVCGQLVESVWSGRDAQQKRGRKSCRPRGWSFGEAGRQTIQRGREGCPGVREAGVAGKEEDLTHRWNPVPQRRVPAGDRCR